MRRAALAVVLAAPAALAQPGGPPPPVAPVLRQCGICHSRPEFKVVAEDGTARSLYVDERPLAASVHARWQCVDCHADIAAIPHPAGLAPVNCQRCHFPGNPVGAPEDVNYEGYTKSVHGRLRLAGNTRAPLCQDCHGGHDVAKRDDPASHTGKRRQPETCGRCHLEVFAQYRESVHGQALLARNNQDAPSCSNCHGEHNILPPKETASEVSATHIPETCSNCHGSMEFNTRYEIPVNPVKTFKHSFHGIANELGSTRVANCASCHTAHAVLPPADPRSSVNPANIPATCGKTGCHEGANANYARGRFHVDPSSRDAGVIYWVALFFKVLTISTMAGLIGHILLDLSKKLRHARNAESHRE